MSEELLDKDAWISVEEDRTRMLYRQAPGAVFVTFAASVGLLMTASNAGPTPKHLAWGGVMLLLMLLRSALAWSFSHAAISELPVRAWDRLYSAAVVLTGIHFALWPILFFPDQPAHQRLLGSLILGAMAGGAIAVLSMKRWLALTYGAALLLPASLMLLVAGVGAEKVGGGLGLLYWLTMFFSVSVTNRSVIDALVFSYRNERLLVESDHQQTALAKANRELKFTQQALERTNRDLEERIVERTMALERLASHDSLTGLANRARLAQLSEAFLMPEGARLAFFFLDLDGFKEINDSMGHAVGDSVLREVSERLKRTASDAVALARWGGDEFVIIRRRADRVSDEMDFAQSLITALREPIEKSAFSVRVDGCVGVALWPEDGKTLDELIHGADMAVYAAKAAGPGQVRRFAEQMAEGGRRYSRLKQALSHTLAAHGEGLRLLYQPIFDAETRRIVSLEALLRWKHPELGDISPAEFIPLAEKSGDIVALGDWVLRASCRFAASFDASALPSICVNVSAQQLKYPKFLAHVESALTESGLDSRRLTLELTESVFASDSEQMSSTLKTLERQGIKIAIDDFGTGYSSLSYLQRLPARTLKIDRSFVRALESGGRPIIEASLSLAQAFGMQVVAEGIENDVQLQTLIGLGVNGLQGFLLGMPSSEHEIRGLLAAETAGTARHSA